MVTLVVQIFYSGTIFTVIYCQNSKFKSAKIHRKIKKSFSPGHLHINTSCPKYLQIKVPKILSSCLDEFHLVQKNRTD